MKKKKLKLKPKKQTIQRWKRDNRRITIILVLLFTLGMLVGGLVCALVIALRPYNQHPRSVVIAADETVTVPGDLVNYLRKQDNCKNYRGANSPDGVPVWAVYQLSRGKFAKISYGCSTKLDFYVMAVKTNEKWQLIQPDEYFGSTGFLPKCMQVEKYQIDKTIEPFCIKEGGQARPNAIN